MGTTNVTSAVEHGRTFEPTRFDELLRLREGLDPHYASLWLRYGHGGLLGRPTLDTRTRLLAVIGQLAMRRSHDSLADHVRGALQLPLPATEVLEVLIQTQLYGGTDVTDAALATFATTSAEFGTPEDLGLGRVPADGRVSERSMAQEEAAWDDTDRRDPRLQVFLDRYGWHGLSVGLRLRPGHHLNIVEYFDTLDPDFTALWLDVVYSGYYNRRILDDRTRLVCQVANCIAIGEEIQGRAHMRGALSAGAQPRELLELILQSSHYFGQPAKINFLRVLVDLLKDLGRSDDLGNPGRAVR